MAWREFIRRNFWLKLFALGLATLTWITIHFAIRHEMGLVQSPLSNVIIREFKALPIRVLTAASDSREFKLNPREASVTVSGEGGLISSLSRNDIQVFINLIDDSQTQDLFKKIDVSGPPGVSVVRVSPPVVHVGRAPPLERPDS